MNTWRSRKYLMFTAALVAVLATLPALAADGDKGTIKGMITAIQGDTITVKDANNVQQDITVSQGTTYKSTKGLTGVVHHKVERGALIPGLPITADGVSAGNGFMATAISFKAEDFKTAQQVQAGLTPTSARVDANAARINEFGTYEALETVEVLFASGKTTISEKGKSDLMALAGKTTELKDYRMVVQGFTDSTGDPAANERLSVARASAVTDFLQQTAGVSPGRVQAGDGMGVAADAGTGNNPSARKVVVKLVVDKGVQGGSK